MSQVVELPDDVFAVLTRVAEASGITPAEWIADRLSHTINGHASKRMPTEQEIAVANVRLEACTVSLGHATGLDNRSIDADLTREDGDNHAAPYPGEK